MSRHYQSRNQEMVEIRRLVVLRETEKAYLLHQKHRGSDSTEVWVPKSMIDYKRKHPIQVVAGEEIQEIDIKIPEWMADEKGFIA